MFSPYINMKNSDRELRNPIYYKLEDYSKMKK